MQYRHHITRREARRWSRTGTEPRTARSDLALRRLLSGIFAPLFLAGTVAFSYLAATAHAGQPVSRSALILFSALCALFLLIALADLGLVRRRMREQRRWGRPPR